MAFDGVFLHSIVNQLQVLVGSRISKIYQISDTEILFVIKKDKIYQLMVSAHSSYNRIHLTSKEYPTRTTPSNFIMLLRKYLEGGFINSIEQVSLDRYLTIEISSRNELGDKINLQLFVELMGKYANLILVNDGKIIDALKHIPPYENTVRTIWPGAMFKPTEPQPNKRNPFEITSIEKNENLFEHLLGFSPLLSSEFEYRLNHGQTYQQIIQEAKTSNKVYFTTINNEEFFHCIKLTHLSNEFESFEICDGLDYIYFNKEEKERIRNISGDLFKVVRKEIKKYNEKIDRLTLQLNQAMDCDIYRKYGELIFANLDKITKGDKNVILKDWDETDVSIPLDNKLDGKGNGKKYYTKYRKLTTGQKYIEEQLQIANDNLDYFQSISEQLELADFLTASEIKTELEEAGFIKAKKVFGKKKKQQEPSYKQIQAGRNTIRIGKNNIQNEFITFKKASRFDTWFHVKDSTGAHVTITTDNPTEKETRLCAMLAAYYSKYRNSSSIPVDYTLVKELKKIPNGKIGKVIMKSYKTIYIDIDTKEIENLLTEKNKS